MARRYLWHRVLAVACVAAACALSGCATSGRARMDGFAGDGGQHLALGRSSLLAGDPASARSHLERAVKQGESAEAHYYLALIEMDESGSSNPEKAESALNRSIKAYPSGQAFLLKGVLAERRKDPAAAEQAYKLGLSEAAPASRTAGILHRNLGVLLAAQQRWDEAGEHFQAYVGQAESKHEAMSDSDLALWGLMLYRQERTLDAQAVWARVADAGLRRSIQQAAGLTPTTARR